MEMNIDCSWWTSSCTAKAAWAISHFVKVRSHHEDQRSLLRSNVKDIGLCGRSLGFRQFCKRSSSSRRSKVTRPYHAHHINKDQSRGLFKLNTLALTRVYNEGVCNNVISDKITTENDFARIGRIYVIGGADIIPFLWLCMVFSSCLRVLASGAASFTACCCVTFCFFNFSTCSVKDWKTSKTPLWRKY